jgi:rRNA processing protein Gar1
LGVIDHLLLLVVPRKKIETKAKSSDTCFLRKNNLTWIRRRRRRRSRKAWILLTIQSFLLG